MEKLFIAIIFIQGFFYNATAQKEIDSLKKYLPQLNGSERIDCLLKISFEYGHINNDSDNIFSPVNTDSAIWYASNALIQSKNINYYKGIANAYENLGEMAYSYNFHEAENYFRQATELYKRINDFKNLNWSYLWLGFYLMYECRFDEARLEFQKAFLIIN